eukprot:g4867.t1
MVIAGSPDYKRKANLELFVVHCIELFIGELPAVVALGKFDALHIGHRALASTAAKLNGHPWLIAFSGMAEVMGWDVSRLPLVAQVEQPYVLGEWTDACLGRTPSMRYLPFANIRQKSPEEFFELLVNNLGVKGVVTGANYRFGYKAAGDVTTLKELGLKHNVQIETVDLVLSSGANGKVSSSKVREALKHGSLHLVKEFLDRDYTLVLDSRGVVQKSSRVFYPSNTYLNQPPGVGKYNALVDSNLVEIQLTEEGLHCASRINTNLGCNYIRVTFVGY